MTAKQAENSYYNAIRKIENRWEITWMILRVLCRAR